MDVPAALEALLAMGWAHETKGEEDALVVPKGKYFSMSEASLPTRRQCCSAARRWCTCPTAVGMGASLGLLPEGRGTCKCTA